MNKLGIERRVQYGAEKMLDVSAILAKVYWSRLTGGRSSSSAQERRTTK
jgi:hypothetical protein